MGRHLELNDVPPGMVGNCPWGTPLERWPTYMLMTGQAELSKPSERGYSDRLLGAITQELDGRGRRNHTNGGSRAAHS